MIARAPAFSADQARQIARDLYGFDAAAARLPSYYDQNFLLEHPSGSRRVLKIANTRDDFAAIDLQNRAIQRAAMASDHFAVARIFPTRDDDLIATLRGRGGARHHVRLLAYVAGLPWSAALPHSRRLREDLGRAVGELGRALAGFSHPAMHRKCEWDLKHSQRLERRLSAVAGPRRRAIIERVLARFADFVGPRLAGLPASVVHGDVNNDNVLVAGGRVVGLIDFGDVVYTATVFESAIAMAYAMLGTRDPLAAGRDVLRGRQAVLPLEPRELEIVFDLARTRLAASATFAAYYGRRDPGNAYVSTNAAAVWRVLEALDEVDSVPAAAS